MRKITLPCFGIVVETDGNGAGGINSDLHENDQVDNPMEECQIAQYNAAMDAIESMILAHACAGVSITSPGYVEGIEAAVFRTGSTAEKDGRQGHIQGL